MSIRLRITIVTTREDWSVARIELLVDFLRKEKDGLRTAVFAVASTDTEPLESADPLLSILDREDFDAKWLAAMDTGAGLRPQVCDTISQPRRCDRGLLMTSKGIGKPFKPAMAFEASPGKGRFIAECSVYHFAGNSSDHAALSEPMALASVRIYVRNVATWLALLESDESDSLTWTSRGLRWPSAPHFQPWISR
jgi:hypothetical protein